MKSFKPLLVLFFAFSLPHISFAQDTVLKATPLRFLIGVAGEFGGDPIAEISFTDGNTQSVKAGQGFTVLLGGQYQFPKAEKFLLRASAGYKYVTTMATNAHIRLTRVPIQLSANYMAAKKLRLSAGLVSHQVIQFKSDGIDQDRKFTASAGPIFEVAYAGVGITYTTMKYSDQQKASYSASSIGVSFTTTISKGQFRRK
jgi:hypothetical protein